MTVRRAGLARLDDGSTITWTVADGRRGRRWRTATHDPDGRLTLALLLELDADGDLSKLELAAPAGLLTLHPEGVRLHGNVVGADGVRHVNLPWGPRHVLLVEGSPVTDAVAASRLAAGVGEHAVLPAVVVGMGLRVTTTEAVLERHDGRVSVASGGTRREARLDGRGIPERFGRGGDWPLELD